MTISSSLYFTYAGINSYDMGLINISSSAGLYNDPIIGSRNLIEDQDIGGKRYLKTIDYEPLEFPIVMYFNEVFNDEKIREISRWLLQDNYQPLVFSNNQNRYLQAVPVGDFDLIHNGLKQGYLSLWFRCDTFHAYTPFVSSRLYDLSENTEEGTMINFQNNGDLETQPIIYLEKVGEGDVTFVNTSDGGKTMTISNVIDGEKITIDNTIHDLKWNSNVNYYNDFDFNWMNLVYGVNRIKVLGNCKFYYKCQFKIY
ncbi:phage tail domain-containing protein [Evansella tamaricis]|uniref:Phage tail family protein n=1 Tax=Evansella tamaricis TaxID=2069301 RepID=A0ABS6JQ35_9BACI|nr:phage tail domain-containing protein [Evansella tamaricis]MBU9714413.1 phage tail family protein [Evansella tamaricis]